MLAELTANIVSLLGLCDDSRVPSFEYAVSIEPGGLARAEDGVPVAFPDSWMPEHLVLAGLVRCTLKSLRFHAARAGIAVAGGGSASGSVAQREDDGRYALVEALCKLDVRLEPLPDDTGILELLAKAERDCFVGASLRASPDYEWRVNGSVVTR
jgi:organic hydroperoxide reductase OsmC/OhrA